MRHLLSDEKQLMDFELLGERSVSGLYHHLSIYFVLSGSLTVTEGEQGVTLGEKDFLFVNPFQHHTVVQEQDALVVLFQVNQAMLAQYYDLRKMVFRCDSTRGEPERYEGFRQLLEQCIVYYYGKRSRDGRVLLRLNSLYYRMAEQMIAEFTEVKREALDATVSDADEILIQDIVHYIQMNYQSQLKLEDMAERFYLSPSYLSRFFKKKQGINFGKYLTDVRLSAAKVELESGEKSLTRIAMDCGFPNLSAFNKVFRERFAMSPKQYRELRAGENQAPEVADADVSYRLLDYFEKNDTALEEETQIVERVEADTAAYQYLNKTWNRVINIGRISMLLQTAIQEHVLFLQKELAFAYVRVWDLYDPEMRIHAEAKDYAYNFTRLDRAIDFLVEHGIKPFIELGFKPYILLDSYLHVPNYTHFEEREIVFEHSEGYGMFVRRLMIHLANRYGMETVADWYFEQWGDPRLFADGNPTRYFDFYDAAYQAIKSVSPRTKLGGNYDRPYQSIDFEHYIQRWSQRSIQPDFFSLYGYPAIPVFDSITTDGYLQPDKVSVFRYIKEQQAVLHRYGMMMPIYLSEWNLTVVNYNAINDSRYKGAFVMQNIMELNPYVEGMGYWFGSDLFAEGDRGLKLLNGRCGLITHQNIGKPAFWAMKFMNRLESCLMAQSPHSMVTMNAFDSYVVACHNCRPLGVQYYVYEEKDITIDNIPGFYQDKKSLLLKIRITGVKNGLYHVKTRCINTQYGAVQDEWNRMGRVAFLNQHDVDYIEHMSRPRITIVEQQVTDNTLRVTAQLEAQEIQCIHLFRHIQEGD